MKETPINFAVLGRKVYKLYPQIAQKLIEQPDFDDLSLIHGMWDYFNTIYTYKENSKRLIFVWVIVKLFNPDVLIKCRPRLIKGLRIQLGATLKAHPTSISHYLEKSIHYMKIYKDFEKQVEFYIELMKRNYNY